LEGEVIRESIRPYAGHLSTTQKTSVIPDGRRADPGPRGGRTA
jgi:hypothetical protein